MKSIAMKPLQAALLFVLWMVSASSALAANDTPAKRPQASNNTAASEAHRMFRDEMAQCASGASVQPRAVCEQEARAAHAQNLRGGLADGGSSGNSTGAAPVYSRNARERCQPLPAAERMGCMMRVDGKAAPGEVLVVPGSEAPLQSTTPPRP